MTLHEAIEKLLKEKNRPMTTTEIARELNQNNWYQKKDGSSIEPFQIHGRTKNYSQIFVRNGSTVSLNGQSNIKVVLPKNLAEKTKSRLRQSPIETHFSEESLMSERNFKNALTIDSLVPNQPGLYCIRIIDCNKLPKQFNKHLLERNHNIIYIGIASQSLLKRFLNQELRAKGHGTFFRSIGAVLGYKPENGSLQAKANKRNYKFKPNDEKQIINWINDNLKVNWVAFSGDFETLETEIIKKYLPLLNIAKNPMALKELIDLRAECVRIANS